MDGTEKTTKKEATVKTGTPAKAKRVAKAKKPKEPKPKKEKTPKEPQVVFADFAADALLFELRFSVNLRHTRKVDVESDLRFAIDDLFAQRGIVMAYPQRDVHLNVLRPVEVRLAQPISQLKAVA